MKDPIVVSMPSPNGSAIPARYFYYKGSIASLEEAALDRISTYEAAGDGESPKLFRLPYVHGWVLSFRKLFGGRCLWVAYSNGNKLLLDTGRETTVLCSSPRVVSASRWYCVARIGLNVALSRKSLWIYVPVTRLLFRDPAAEDKHAEPIVDLFEDLQSQEGCDRWLKRWTSGVAHISTALTVTSSSRSGLSAIIMLFAFTTLGLA